MNTIINIFKAITYDITRFFAWLHFYILFPPKYVYEEGANKKRNLKQGGLIVSNHKSWLDGPFLSTVFVRRRVSFVIADVVYKNIFLKVFFWFVNAIKINRIKLDLEALNQVKKRLLQNKVLVIFPEGKITSGDTKYKPGAVVMSLMAKKPITPVYIGKYKLFKRTKVVIGKEIVFPHQTMNKQDIQTYTHLLEVKMEQLKERSNGK